jgi:hypothetical protein
MISIQNDTLYNFGMHPKFEDFKNPPGNAQQIKGIYMLFEDIEQGYL